MKDNYFPLEYPACPSCEGIDQDIVYIGFHLYKVVQCRSCGLYYLSPRPTEDAMVQLYKSDTYFGEGTVGYESYVEQEQSLRETFHRLMRNLKRYGLTGGKLLEVGCGYGFLLDEARQFFEIRVGTEFSPQAVELARSRADSIYEGGIDQLPADEKFDCIIVLHVIEHVYRPGAFLNQLCKRLNTGGKMVVATPDMGSLWRRIMGRYWPSFKFPEHVAFFDERTLSVLMEQNGLVDIKRLPYPHAFPISTIARKLQLRSPSVFSKLNVWVPGTTLAMVGEVIER
jgi:SAM-dependent methyltransferase